MYLSIYIYIHPWKSIPQDVLFHKDFVCLENFQNTLYCMYVRTLIWEIHTGYHVC